jgi:hypothetical protein
MLDETIDSAKLKAENEVNFRVESNIFREVNK